MVVCYDEGRTSGWGLRLISDVHCQQTRQAPARARSDPSPDVSREFGGNRGIVKAFCEMASGKSGVSASESPRLHCRDATMIDVLRRDDTPLGSPVSGETPFV